jgi:ABC-2 type transport system permease protein
MTALRRLIAVETRLLLREVGVPLIAVLVPIVILVALGAIPAMRQPDATFDGRSFLDVFCPSLVVLTLAVLGANTLPARIASYREKGVLRRMSTTPVHPGYLLAAQVVVNLAIAVVAVAALLATARLGFGVVLPQHPAGFLAAFLLGTAAVFACGLLVAAIAPNSRVAAALIVPLFVLSMFFGGVYLPRFLLPEVLVRIGDYTPPGVQALQDSWTGSGPNPVQLGIMAVITVALGGLAARAFRWE